MNLIYAVLCFAMAAFNLYRSAHGTGAINGIFALLWLGIGVYLMVQFFIKKRKNKE